MRFRPKCDWVREPFVDALPADQPAWPRAARRRILYSAAKRPSSQNPNCVAIAVTVAAAVQAASRRACRARCIRRRSRNRIGPIPICSWQHRRQCPLRHPDHLTDLREIHSAVGICLQHAAKPAHDELVLSLCRSVLADLPAAETGDHGFDQCLLEPARSVGIGDDFGDLSARFPAAACSRWSLAIAAGEGLTISASRGGVRSHPAIAAPTEAIASTGSDMPPQQADPDECWKLAPPSWCRRMLIGCNSAPHQTRLGPGSMRNEMMARPGKLANARPAAGCRRNAASTGYADRSHELRGETSAPGDRQLALVARIDDA